MSWLTANPWPLATLFAVASTAALYSALRGAGARSWFAAAILLALVPLPFVADALIETDEEAVGKRLTELVQAAERGDTATLIAALGSDYFDGQRDRDGMEALVKRQLPPRGGVDIAIAGLELSASQGQVTARFVAHINERGGGAAATYPVRLGLVFVHQDGWRIQKAQRYDLIEAMREVPLDRIP